MKSKLILIIFFAAVSLAFSGDEKNPQGETQTKTSSEANAGIIFNQGDNNSVSTTSRQFVPAVPAGPNMNVFPGPGLSGKTEKKVVLLPGNMTEEEIENASRRTTSLVADIALPWRWGGKKRIYPVVFRKSARISSNVVKFVDWNPYQFGYNDDVLYGAVTVVGEPWWPEMRFVAEGVKVCKDMGAIRVSMLRHEVIASKTETSVKGLSLGGASVNGSNDVALGSAVGYGKGTSTSYPETWPVYEMVCLNDGPTRRPSTDLCANIDGIQESVPSGLVQKGSSCVEPSPPMEKKTEINVNVPEIKIKIEHVYPESVPISRNLTPRPLAPEPESSYVNPCAGMPQVTIYFDHYKSNIRDRKERLKIEEFANWWKNGHTACRFQVRGNCSISGSFKLNNNLGMDRATSVTNVLKELGVNPAQFVSGGKYNTIEGNEYSQPDRRVVFQEIGEASGR